MSIRNQIKSFTGNHAARLAVLSAIVGIITLKDADYQVFPGIDDSFRWALNYLLAQDRQQFAHISYPVGPLCFFKWPSIVGSHIFISACLQVILNFIFTWLLCHLYRLYHKTDNLLPPALLSIGFLMIVNVDYIFLGCIACSLLLWDSTRKWGYAIASLALTAITIYIKASFYALTLSLWLVYTIRLLIKKEFKVAGMLIIAGALICFITGWVVLGSPVTTFSYLSNNLLMPFSYSDALAMFPYNSWKTLAVSILLLLACLVLFFRQPGGLVIKLLAVCLFANWKYSMLNEDFFHVIFFSYLLILTTVLFIAVQVKKQLQGALLLLLSLCFFNYNLRFINESPQYFWFPGLVHFENRILNHRELKKRAVAESEQNCKSNILPQEWMEEIKGATVDIFPWDLSIIMINKLNYAPRPSLQSPPMNIANEQKDIAFLRSAQAPDYIIWHATNAGRTNIDGIMNGYLPNQCPELLLAMLENYSLTKKINDRFALYKKRVIPEKLSQSAAGTANAAWGDWIAVPVADTGQLILASVKFENTPVYTFVKLLYKESRLTVEYEKNDGAILSYQFSKMRAEEGMLINPLFTGCDLSTTGIRRIRLLNADAVYFSKTISINWERITGDIR